MRLFHKKTKDNCFLVFFSENHEKGMTDPSSDMFGVGDDPFAVDSAVSSKLTSPPLPPALDDIVTATTTTPPSPTTIGVTGVSICGKFGGIENF